MVYLFQYRQKTKDDLAYSRLCKALEDSGYVHIIARGRILVSPTCHIYLLREKLTRYLRKTDQLTITPVLINDYSDPGAHGFVEFWSKVPEYHKPPTLFELRVQTSAYA